jgi:hypothetical protein
VAEGHMTTGSGTLFKFPEFFGSTTYYTHTSATVLKPKSATAMFKNKNLFCVHVTYNTSFMHAEQTV